MQLNHEAETSRPTRVRRNVAGTVAAAACTLLGAASGPSIANDTPKWTFDTALLYYSETDRVTDLSGSFFAIRRFGDVRKLSMKFTVDSLTGASANGTVPSAAPQTFTTASGTSAGYTAAAGETPLDPTFLDTRVALSANWVEPIGRRMRLDVGVSASNEYDYLHTGVNARLSRDFNRRNTTLDVGLAFANDRIEPVGGAPVPLSALSAGVSEHDDEYDELVYSGLGLGEGSEGGDEGGMGSQSKTVTDLVVGVTQVLGKRTLGQLNYSLSHASGYLTDPYKLLSVVDPVTGEPSPNLLSGNDLVLHEGRPDTRTQHGLFARVKHALKRDLIDVSYRLAFDDWGVQSHTFDLRYRLRFRSFYLQPHVRYYTQGAADFYRRVLFDGEAVPEFATADYRLGDLDTTTVGLKWGIPFGDGREWSLRAEYYEQSGTSPSRASVGVLRGFDLFPDVDAIVLQVGYRF